MIGLNALVGLGSSQITSQVKPPSIGSQFASFLLQAGREILPVVPQIIAQKALPKAVASQFTPVAQQQQQQQQQQSRENLQADAQRKAAQQRVSDEFARVVPIIAVAAVAVLGGGVLLYIWRRGGR